MCFFLLKQGAETFGLFRRYQEITKMIQGGFLVCYRQAVLLVLDSPEVPVDCLFRMSWMILTSRARLLLMMLILAIPLSGNYFTFLFSLMKSILGQMLRECNVDITKNGNVPSGVTNTDLSSLLLSVSPF